MSFESTTSRGFSTECIGVTSTIRSCSSVMKYVCYLLNAVITLLSILCSTTKTEVRVCVSGFQNTFTIATFSHGKYCSLLSGGENVVVSSFSVVMVDK